MLQEELKTCSQTPPQPARHQQIKETNENKREAAIDRRHLNSHLSVRRRVSSLSALLAALFPALDSSIDDRSVGRSVPRAHQRRSSLCARAGRFQPPPSASATTPRAAAAAAADVSVM